MTDNFHSWECLSGKSLVCTQCKTVSSIEDEISRTALAAKKDAKLQVLTHQLNTRVLKKSAHEDAYAWVRQNNPDSLPVTQESFL